MYAILYVQTFLCGFAICRSAGLVSYYANLVNTDAVRSVRRGGNLNDGGKAGPCYMNANNAPANGNWNYGGARLLTSRSTYAFGRSLYSITVFTIQHRISLSGVAKATEIRPTGTA